MKKMGFPCHLVELIHSLYQNQQSAVRTSGGDTEWFEMGRGVRQGCILSPNLSNIYLEDMMREDLEGFNGGVKFGGTKITNLRYADDITLICNSRHELLDLIRRIKDASEKNGLLLNTKKTMTMVVDRNRTKEDFTVDGPVPVPITHGLIPVPVPIPMGLYPYPYPWVVPVPVPVPIPMVSYPYT